jgi:NADH-quinone oxidoreductase subunit J
MLLFIFENEFLALFFLIIYLGAIAVLFLFVIMMLDINKEYSSQTKRFYFPIGILIGSVLLIEILGVVNKTFFVLNLTEVQQNYTNGYLNWYNTVDSCLDINVLGQIFYTHYVIQLLIAGLILYITVIGISFLTIQSLFYNRKKNQAIFKQISRKNIL